MSEPSRVRFAALLLVLAVLTHGCSVGMPGETGPGYSRNLHTNLDMPRQNVEILDEQIIVSPFVTGALRCAALAYEHGAVGAGNSMVIGAALGNAQFGCAVWGPVPLPRRPLRIDAASVTMIQADSCVDRECWCKIYYFPDPWGAVRHDELMHCRGFRDQHPKVDKLAYNERLFERDQDR